MLSVSVVRTLSASSFTSTPTPPVLRFLRSLSVFGSPPNLLSGLSLGRERRGKGLEDGVKTKRVTR